MVVDLLWVMECELKLYTLYLSKNFRFITWFIIIFFFFVLRIIYFSNGILNMKRKDVNKVYLF